MRHIMLLLLAASLLAGAPGKATVERLRAEFRNPPREFTQVPFWFWNGEITEAGIREQIASMEEKGVYGFVIHARMGLSKKVGYMTPRWLELVRFAVEEAARRGMIVYLYDEGMYPSGSAHGAVVKNRPDLVSYGLRMEKKPVAQGPGYLQPEPDAAAKVVIGGYQYTFRKVPSGGVIRGVFFNEEDDLPGAPRSADLLNPVAVSRFIRFTHERYREAVGEHFGKTIRGIFTDEPNILGRRAAKGLMPWSKTTLLPRISKIVGYDFGPYLRLLWEEDERGLYEAVRADYRWAIARLLNERYYRPLWAWSGDHGLALTGHPAGGGDLLPEAWFTQPGQDVVWRTVLPGETALTGEQSLTAKTASSMALHLGRKTVVNECYGAYGWRLTMSEMKWLADWLFVRGTNLLMPHAFYYSVEGPRINERPPDLAWSNLWWDHYKQFSDYVNRLSWLMRGGEPVADVAILAIGGEARWRAARVLLESQIDFFYVEETLLDEARISDGRLRVGPAEYKVVVLDGARFLRPETRARLNRLLAGKVKVVAYDSTLSAHPLLPDKRTPAERWLSPERAADTAALLRAVRAAAPPDIETETPAPGLRYAHRVKDGMHFYLLTNEADEPIHTRLHVAQSSIPELWDAESGRSSAPVGAAVERGRLRFDLSLEPRNSVVLAFTGAARRGARSWPEPRELSVDSNGWRLELARHDFEQIELGDWTRLPGAAEFSGTGWYERELPLEFAAGEKVTLDLGDVREFAVVEVNGQRVGVRLWPPYRFDITGALKPGTNRIRIGVTNTRANELTAEKLPSGLIGPVRLLASGR